MIHVVAIKTNNTQSDGVSTEEGKELARSIRGQFMEVAVGEHSEPIHSLVNSLVYRDMVHELEAKRRAVS